MPQAKEKLESNVEWEKVSRQRHKTFLARLTLAEAAYAGLPCREPLTLSSYCRWILTYRIVSPRVIFLSTTKFVVNLERNERNGENGKKKRSTINGNSLLLFFFDFLQCNLI